MSDSGPPPPVSLPRPADVEGALDEVLGRLGSLDGALIGGVALAVFGIERFTKDVDLAVPEAETARATRTLSDADPRPLRIGGVSVATRAGARVDLIDRRVGLRALYEEAVAAARARGPRLRVGARELPVVPIEYLAAMKMAADRPQDEVDLDRLLRLEQLDYQRCRAIVSAHLGFFAASRLDRLARAGGRPDAPEDYAADEYGDAR